MYLKIKKIISQNKILISLIVVSFVIRIVLVSRDYPYLLNVDEAAFIRSATGLRFNILIDHFDWPHLGFYFHYLIYEIFIKFRAAIVALGIKDEIQYMMPMLFKDPFIFYVLSKTINVILSVLAAVPVYLVAKKIFNKTVGLYASFILLASPYFLSASVLATIDAPLIFFVMYAVYFMIKASEFRSFKMAFIAGLFIGAAGSFKYNGILFLAYFFGIRMYTLADGKKTLIQIFTEAFSFIKFYIASFISAIIAFMAFNFSLFFNFDTFWSYKYGRGLLWQIFVNSKAVPFDIYIKHLQELFIRSVEGINMAAIVIGMFGFIILIFDLKTKIKSIGKLKILFIFSFLFSLGYFLFFAKSHIAGPRYFIPLYGILALFLGYFCKAFIDFVSKVFVLQKSIFNGLLIRISILLVIATPLIYSVIYEYKTSTIVYALNYAKDNKSIIYIDGEKIYNLSELNNMHIRKSKDKFAINEQILTDHIIDDPRLELLYTFLNDYRRGPVLYVYQVVDYK